MIIAYLAPYYPHGSHSFIRREIAALERQDFTVKRFSIRPPHGLVDTADLVEAPKTVSLISRGIGAIIVATFMAAVKSPLRFLRALRIAIRFGRRSERGVVRHLIYLAEACLFLRCLQQCGAAHVHSHFGTNSTTVALLAHVLGGPNFSFTVHGPEEFDRPHADSLKDKIAAATFVVAVSSFGRSQLLRWCDRRNWDKIHIVHCGLDASFLGADSVPMPTAPRIVCVGRLAEQKGQLILLQALALLKTDGINPEVLFAGDGPMRREIESEIIRLGLSDTVRVSGWLSGADVRREIEASRVMVLPSFAEGLPVVIMESLALGRPIISTYVAGIPELVRNGVDGWLVPPGSVEELAAAIRMLLEASPARLTEMGKAGSTRVAERHDAAIEAGKLAELFRCSCECRTRQQARDS